MKVAGGSRSILYQVLRENWAHGSAPVNISAWQVRARAT